ncbi:hypothetical protein [Leptospira alexanderi]|uniref:hypothetical protein n=1 Tax=Leptospira alexanderi TaxID=100053 RepID=UPI0002888437|nr:hypothetical protein [Leptospira alexanderi]
MNDKYRSFNLVFAEKHMGSEREHCFSPAAYCFDCFTFAPAQAIVVVAFWARLQMPFGGPNTPLLDDHSLDSKLRENSFRLSPDQVKALTACAAGVDLSPGLSQYFDETHAPLPEYFLSLSWSDRPRSILRSHGVAPAINHLLPCIRAIIAENREHIGGKSLWPDPMLVSALQDCWRFDSRLPSVTASSKTVLPIEINRKREPLL